MIKEKDKELLFGKMEINMKVHGMIIRKMVLEFIFKLMVMFLMVNGLTIK